MVHSQTALARAQGAAVGAQYVFYQKGAVSLIRFGQVTPRFNYSNVSET